MCLEKPLNLDEKIRKAMQQSQVGSNSFGPVYDDNAMVEAVSAVINEHRNAEGCKGGALVTVQMNIEQAAAVSKALDVYVRLGIGQLDIVKEMVNQGYIPLRAENGDPRQVATFDQVDRFTEVMDSAKSILGYPRSGSNGIGHSHVAKEVHRSYEVAKVMDRAIATYRDPNPKFRGVNYDGLIVRYTTDPAPKAFVE